MRKKIVAQLALFDILIHSLMTLIQPDRKLKRISRILDDNPDILDTVHHDMTKGTQKTGRKGLSAERVLRTAILKQYKRLSYRELKNRINDNVTFRWFTRFYTDNIPHHTTLQKAIAAIDPQTWQHINDILVVYAQGQKIENGRSIRTDTTVTQTNIAYPLDARLLNDSVCVLTRVMAKARYLLPDLTFNFHKRTRRAKKRSYQIVMAKGPKTKERRQVWYRDLIKVTNEVFAMAGECRRQLIESPHMESDALFFELDHYLDRAAVAIEQAERRILHGQKVPADEKIVSLFEDHTDIIKRGKSQSPTEFGHKVLVTSGPSGLVTQYRVFQGNPSDDAMLPDILAKHKEQYQKPPWHLSGDRRFFSAHNEEIAFQAGVKRVSIKKPGYRSQDRIEIEKERWFKKLQRFRAGIEGLISALMRGYGLKRCLWKGYRAFESYVGLGVVTFNLQKIALLI